MSATPLRIRAPNKPAEADETDVPLVPAKNGFKKTLSWRPKLTNVRVYTPVSSVSGSNTPSPKGANTKSKRRRTRRGRQHS